jgi:hypothetical protein
MTSPASPNRAVGPLVAAACTAAIVVAVAWWARTGAPVGAYIDDGFYAILGRALATGHGLSYVSWPGAPAPGHYPPGYPAVLALAWRLTGSLAGVASWGLAFNAIALGVSAAAVAAALVGWGRVPMPVAVTVAVAGAVATPVLAVSTLLLSEPVALVLIVATLWAASPPPGDAARSGRAALAGLLGGAAVLVRTIAIAAPLAAVAAACVQRRYRDACIITLVTLALVGPWVAWSAMHPATGLGPLDVAYGSYLGYYLDAVGQRGPGFAGAVVWANVLALGRTGRALFAPWPTSWWTLPIAGALVGVLTVGLRTSWRRSPALALFIAFYGATILAWPYDPSRFLWGIWPLVVGILAMGGTALVGGIRHRATAFPALRWIGALAVALVTVGYARTTILGLAARGWERSQLVSIATARPIIAWARSETPPDAVIATPYDPMVYLYSGRRTLPLRIWRGTDYLAPGTAPHGDDDLRAIVEYFRPGFMVVPGRADVVAGRLQALLATAAVTVRPVADLAGGNAALALDWPLLHRKALPLGPHSRHL